MGMTDDELERLSLKDSCLLAILAKSRALVKKRKQVRKEAAKAAHQPETMDFESHGMSVTSDALTTEAGLLQCERCENLPEEERCIRSL